MSLDEYDTLFDKLKKDEDCKEKEEEYVEEDDDDNIGANNADDNAQANNENGEDSSNEDADGQYASFFKKSKFANGQRSPITEQLKREEIKWHYRAMWLETFLNEIMSTQTSLQKLVPWF